MAAGINYSNPTLLIGISNFDLKMNNWFVYDPADS